MTESAVKQSLSFSIEAKLLIDTLKVVGGVIENTQVIPILSHVKLEISNGNLTATASDSEIEMTATTSLESACDQSFSIAVSCRKLLDICKTFSGPSIVNLTLENGWLCVESQQSKFLLATLSASHFPKLHMDDDAHSWSIASKTLHSIIQNTAFAMAEQDVRFFLNGLHLSIDKDFIHVSATDGHRLASAESNNNISSSQAHHCIIPRKTTLTLARLLNGLEEDITITQSTNHIQITAPQFSMTSNLLEGSKIDCQQLIPNKKIATPVDLKRDVLKQALSRAAILSHEKFRGAKINFTANCMNVMAHNAEQEKTEENIPVVYEHEPLEMAFNIHYLQDLINVLSTDIQTWYFLKEKGTVLVEDATDDAKFTYVVMSMHI